MLIIRYCNLIGTANIPAVHTKTCPNTPDVFFPLPSFRRAQYTCARKIRLARETRLHHRYYTSLRGSTGVNGPNMRLRMEAMKSTALLRSYSTSTMVLALAIVLDLALPLYGVSNCVWLAVSCIRGAKVHGGEGWANAWQRRLALLVHDG